MCVRVSFVTLIVVTAPDKMYRICDVTSREKNKCFVNPMYGEIGISRLIIHKQANKQQTNSSQLALSE